jgi:hypothetical protein
MNDIAILGTSQRIQGRLSKTIKDPQAIGLNGTCRGIGLLDARIFSLEATWAILPVNFGVVLMKLLQLEYEVVALLLERLSVSDLLVVLLSTFSS